MSEEQIIQAIVNICRDSTLYFQIIVQDNILHVYINRQTDIDYQLITRQIFTAIDSIESLSFNGIYLYSRLLGEIEPDWQTYLVTKKASKAALDSINYLATEITAEIEDTNVLVENLRYHSEVESLVEDVVEQVRTTSSLVSKLQKQLSTKTFDSMAEELGEDSTGELIAEVNHHQNSANFNLAQSQSTSETMSIIETIDRVEAAAETQILLGVMLIETAIIDHNKALIYFCLSHTYSKA